MSQRLSEHFTLHECERSQSATRLGIDNSLPKSLLPFAENLARGVLEDIRTHFGIAFSPSSWYRCKALNTAIKGAENSSHIGGNTADIEVSGIDNKELALWIDKNCVFDKMILEFYKGEPTSGWVHIEAMHPLSKKPRHEFLQTADGKNYYPVKVS